VAAASGGASSKDVKAGGAFVEVSIRDKTTAVFAKISERATYLGKVLAGIGGGIVGLSLPFFKGGVERAVEIDRLSTSLGIASEEMQRLKYAADLTGLSIDQIRADPDKFKELLADAPIMDQQTIRDSVTANRALKKSLIEIQTALTPLVSFFANAAKQISIFIQNNKGLFYAITATGGALVGVGVGVAVLGKLLPVVLFSYRALVVTIVASRIAIASVATAIVTVSKLAITATGIIGGLRTALAGLRVSLVATKVVLLLLLKPWILLPLLVGGAITAFLLFTDAGKKVLKWVSDLGKQIGSIGVDIADVAKGAAKTWVEMGQDFGRAFGVIVERIQAGDLEGAFEVVVAGLEYSWKKLTLNMQMLWDGVVAHVKESKNDILASAEKTSADLAGWGLRNRKTITNFLFGPGLGGLINQKDFLGFGGAITDQAINAGRDSVKQDIDNDLAKKQADLDREFLEKIRQAEEELQKARNKFNEKIQNIGARRDEKKPDSEGDLTPTIAAVRGAFRLGANASQQFGEGTNLVKKQIEVAEKQLEKLDEAVEAIVALGKGLAFK
jgi:hypothetical protein